MLDTCGITSVIDRRDRALLLLGLASALRRSELAALTVADLDFVEEA
jgi:integrase